MDNPTVTQRVIDAATLILTTAAYRTEQTACTTTHAFTYAEDRTAETYRLTRIELANAARLATHAAFTTGAYSINAMTNPTVRATALRTAIPNLANRDQPCSTEFEPRSPVPRRPPRHTPPKTFTGSARH